VSQDAEHAAGGAKERRLPGYAGGADEAPAGKEDRRQHEGDEREAGRNAQFGGVLQEIIMGMVVDHVHGRLVVAQEGVPVVAQPHAQQGEVADQIHGVLPDGETPLRHDPFLSHDLFEPGENRIEAQPDGIPTHQQNEQQGDELDPPAAVAHRGEHAQKGDGEQHGQNAAPGHRKNQAQA